MSFPLDLTFESLSNFTIDSQITDQILIENSIYGPPVSINALPSIYNATFNKTSYELIKFADPYAVAVKEGVLGP